MLNSLPRNYKFTIGDRVHNHLEDLLEMLIDANYTSADKKRPILIQVNVKLEKLRYYFRLGYDLGFYTSIKYADFAAKLDEIGRLTGGWIKSLPPQ